MCEVSTRSYHWGNKVFIQGNDNHAKITKRRYCQSLSEEPAIVTKHGWIPTSLVALIYYVNDLRACNEVEQYGTDKNMVPLYPQCFA